LPNIGLNPALNFSKQIQKRVQTKQSLMENNTYYIAIQCKDDIKKIKTTKNLQFTTAYLKYYFEAIFYTTINSLCVVACRCYGNTATEHVIMFCNMTVNIYIQLYKHKITGSLQLTLDSYRKVGHKINFKCLTPIIIPRIMVKGIWFVLCNHYLYVISMLSISRCRPTFGVVILTD